MEVGMVALQAPKISVLTPAFNASAFLERGVLSVVGQSFESTEIVIVNDASTDKTLELARDLSARYSNVRVIDLHKNGGPSVARNAAIEAACGQWLAILDADDAYLSDHLERVQALAVEYDADVVLSNFQYFDPGSGLLDETGVPRDDRPRRVDKYQYVENARPLLSHQDWGLLKPMFRAEFLKTHSIRYPEYSRHGEDFLVMVQCFLAGAKVVLSQLPSYVYTARSSGWSRTKVDYDAVVAQSKALIQDPRVANDERMVSILRARISATKTFAARHRSQALWKGRAFGELFSHSLRDREMGKAALHLAAAKIYRSIRVR